MKKILICLISSTLMFLGITGCMNNEAVSNENNDVNTNNTTNNNVNSSTNQTEQSKYNQEESLASIDAYVNYRDDALRVEGVSSFLYAYPKQRASATVVFSTDPYEGDLNGVLDTLMPVFGRAVKGYMRGTFTGNELKLAHSEKVTVAGFDSIRFQGTIYNNITDCYIYGYTFIINGQPCMIAGVVASDEQEQELIDNVTRDADEMAKTIRLGD